MRAPSVISQVGCGVVLTLCCMELGDENSYDLLGDDSDKGVCSGPLQSLTSLKPAIRGVNLSQRFVNHRKNNNTKPTTPMRLDAALPTFSEPEMSSRVPLSDQLPVDSLRRNAQCSCAFCCSAVLLFCYSVVLLGSVYTC
jgi:hypothetical protein